MKWFSRKHKLIFFGGLFLLGLSLFLIYGQEMQASAANYGLFEDTNDDVKKILLLYDDYLTQGNIMLFVLRWLGWMLILLLERGVTLFSQATLDILNIGNFAESDAFQGIMTKLHSLENFLLLLALLSLFFLMMVGKKVELTQAATNLMLSMLIVIALPVFVTTMLGVAQDISKGLSRGDQGLNIGQKTVIDNTADLTVFAENNWIDPDKIKKKTDLTNIKYVRITQQITKPEEFGGEGVLGYNLDYVDGKEVAAKFDPDVGFGKRWAQDLIGEGYYRWHVNFVTVIVTLLALNFAFLLSGIRMGRMMIELAFNQGFANYLAFADFRTMSRLKQVLFNIVGILCTIVAMFSAFSIFSAFTNFIVEEQLTGTSYLLALIGAIWFVIDGPIMVQKVLGVDAGIQSAWGIVGGAMGVKAAAGVAKSAGGVAASAVDLGARAAGYSGGALAGLMANTGEQLAAGINQGNDSKESKNPTGSDATGINEGQKDTNHQGEENSDGLSEGSTSSESNTPGNNVSEKENPNETEGLNQSNKTQGSTNENSSPETSLSEKGINEGSDTANQVSSSEKATGINDTQPSSQESSENVSHVTPSESVSPRPSNQRPTLSGKIGHKVKESKVGQATQNGYNRTRRPKK
ncbi:pLS20_p028 family conjugation system transmembrane protein [Listeria goaensis]|uniref:pLS20_p028 family conjugation system transmembrane protein n=1 Tax=Listeria goaensis TaxID=1649188 RepID=UPI000B590A85|nr:hypothetical protein [Listeria goaensis]